MPKQEHSFNQIGNLEYLKNGRKSRNMRTLVTYEMYKLLEYVILVHIISFSFISFYKSMVKDYSQ